MFWLPASILYIACVAEEAHVRHYQVQFILQEINVNISSDWFSDKKSFCFLYSLVGMALPKVVGYMLAILVIYYSLENQGYGQSLNVFFEVRIRINKY